MEDCLCVAGQRGFRTCYKIALHKPTGMSREDLLPLQHSKRHHDSTSSDKSAILAAFSSQQRNLGRLLPLRPLVKGWGLPGRMKVFRMSANNEILMKRGHFVLLQTCSSCVLYCHGGWTDRLEGGHTTVRKETGTNLTRVIAYLLRAGSTGRDVRQACAQPWPAHNRLRTRFS